MSKSKPVEIPKRIYPKGGVLWRTKEDLYEKKSPKPFDYDKMRQGLVRQKSDISDFTPSPKSFDYDKMRQGLVRQKSDTSNFTPSPKYKISDSKGSYKWLIIGSIFIVLFLMFYFGMTLYYENKVKPEFLQQQNSKKEFNDTKLISMCLILSFFICLLFYSL